MKKDRLTIIIQPDWFRSLKKVNSISSVTFPKRVLYFFLLNFLLLVIFGICGSWSIRENIILKSKIVLLHEELDHQNEIVAQVESIRENETIIRES
jgi:hypothetical protein